MKKRVHLVICGRVQGVCFRAYAADEGQRLGLGGWVRNMPDGAVEAVAEGEEERLGEFVAWCRHGPSYARVTGLTAEYSEAAGEFESFTITY